MRIEMPRGDLRPVEFHIKTLDGEPAQIDFDEIYFTVKRYKTDKQFLFQKRLSTGEIERIDDGVYAFTIEPEDTDPLSMDTTYLFDIEVIVIGEIKQTFKGTLYLTSEVTSAINEG